eukprot:GHVL01024808.1.p1 GENE.GHVL01024808.1~~GHVL01024808.1.p1  ORF type:complete len:284 (+),score=44.49 GHVL01024808.1:130-981(+)
MSFILGLLSSSIFYGLVKASPCYTEGKFLIPSDDGLRYVECKDFIDQSTKVQCSESLQQIIDSLELPLPLTPLDIAEATLADFCPRSCNVRCYDFEAVTSANLCKDIAPIEYFDRAMISCDDLFSLHPQQVRCTARAVDVWEAIPLPASDDLLKIINFNSDTMKQVCPSLCKDECKHENPTTPPKALAPQPTQPPKANVSTPINQPSVAPSSNYSVKPPTNNNTQQRWGSGGLIGRWFGQQNGSSSGGAQQGGRVFTPSAGYFNRFDELANVLNGTNNDDSVN